MSGPTNRPNVLWLFCEDLSPWLPAYGHDVIPTPHIDALAAEGVLFENCFATSPVCSPARSAVITGCMQTTLGIHQHRSGRCDGPPLPLPGHVKTIPELFVEAGYFTYNHGKDDYNFTFDRDSLYIDTDPVEDFGFFGVHGGGHWRQRAAGQPFFGQVMHYAGKNKNAISDPTSPADVPVPPYYPDHPAFREQIARHYDQARLTDAEVGEIIAQLKADGLYESTIIVFLGDHGWQLPRDKCLCYDGGLRVPLIIAWPGNPGAVGRGIRRTDLCTMLDITATTLTLAGLDVPDWMESRNLFADDYRRGHIVAARDRCDWNIDRIRAVRTDRWKYLRNFYTDRPALPRDYRAGQEFCKVLAQMHADGALTDEQSHILRTPRPAEELYDLAADPNELHNLAADPACADTLAELRATLDGWIAETGDKGQYPESAPSLRTALARWGDRCINPEYDRVR